MERLILSPLTELFSGKQDFLKGRPKFPNGISEWKKCVPFASFLLVPGLLAWIAFDPIFEEKVLEMERAHPRENFYLGFDSSHLLQLSTNWFFRVNGKNNLPQPFPQRSRFLVLTKGSAACENENVLVTVLNRCT